MKRVWLLLVGALVLGGLAPGVALAAGSPTVSTGAATKVTTTSVVLNASVTPNGHKTGYSFSYGTTTAFGAATPTRNAGRGARPVAISQPVSGLTPGTTYYYRVNALNASGGTSGATKRFKTSGPPPPGAVTGPTVQVGKTTATITGSITTNGAPTTWLIQYGLGDVYGLETFPQVLPASTVPTPVTYDLAGLSPAKLFHYRLVAYHAGLFAGAGADATFFTEPDRPPKPDMTTRTTPSADKRAPYQFTTAGTLHGRTFIPAAQRCAGNVGIRYYNGKKQLAHVVAPVTPSCTFSGSVSIRKTGAKGPVKLKVTIDYRGTGYLAPVNKVNHVTAH